MSKGLVIPPSVSPIVCPDKASCIVAESEVPMSSPSGSIVALSSSCALPTSTDVASPTGVPSINAVRPKVSSPAGRVANAGSSIGRVAIVDSAKGRVSIVVSAKGCVDIVAPSTGRVAIVEGSSGRVAMVAAPV